MKINATPTNLIDDLRIYCHKLRERDLSLNQIGLKIGKTHWTVMYHLQRYKELAVFDKDFIQAIANFNEEKFVEKLKKIRFKCN